MTFVAHEDRVAHFILMRFNVRTKHRAEARDAAIRSQAEWLNTRFELFEQFCWPTISAQSSKDFELHVYFDNATSREHLKRFKEITAGHPLVKLITCDYFDTNLVIAEIKNRLLASHAFVLTTRLDNDDGLHRDFVKELQAEVRIGVREAINFPVGLVIQRCAAYLSRQDSNAFISVVERKLDFETVLQTSHNQIKSRFVIRDIVDRPMWLQHVHGGNVSNKVRGRRLTRASLPSGFESVALTSRIKPVGQLTTTCENFTVGALRASRDIVAKTVRAVRLRT